MRSAALTTILGLAVALLDACGENGAAPGGTAGTSAPSGAAGTSAPAGTGAAGTTGTQVVVPPPSERCQAIAAAIANATRGQLGCTTLVRVDAATLAIIAHARVCGPSAPVDEPTARALAMQAPAGDIATGGLPSSAKPTLVGGTPDDQWVYLTRVGDFGAAIAIDARSGLIAFQARWDWIWSEHSLRAGPIVAPASWSETDLGVGCATPTQVPVRTFDLREPLPNPKAPPKSAEDAVNAVLSTALPAGLAALGGAKNVVALLFPQWRYGEGHRLEYVVLVNAVKAP